MTEQLTDIMEEFQDMMSDHIELLEEAIDTGEVDPELGDEWMEACQEALDSVQNLDREV